MSDMGSRLRKSRMDKGLNQVEVFKKTGINNKTLSRYENGGTEPDADSLRKLAELYDVTVDYLVGRSKITNDQAKNDVLEAYARLPHSKKKLIDDMIKELDDKGR